MIRREVLQEVLGDSVRVSNLSLYHEALIHKSASRDYGMSQERLEHLGDAVLSLCVAHMLFIKYPNEDEGVLTRMRTRMVNGKTLAEIGRKMGIEKAVILSANTSLDHDRIYEDTFEALIGAVYLDNGLETAREFVATQYDLHMEPGHITQDTNYKDLMKKATTRRGLQAPRYVTVIHEDVFTCQVYIAEHQYGAGDGNTKKAAEMEAAHNAIAANFPQYLESKIH